MSLEKLTPDGLKVVECEHGMGGKNAPIRYIPEQDPVQDALGGSCHKYAQKGHKNTLQIKGILQIPVVPSTKNIVVLPGIKTKTSGNQEVLTRP